MSPEHPQSDQSIIDAHQMSRILHDAELIEGGADVENGQLYPTASQVEVLSSEPDVDLAEDAYEGLGSLVLHNELEEEMKKPLDRLMTEAENQQDLGSKVERALNPYIGIFDDKVPAWEPDPPKKLLRKQKAPQASGAVTWEQSSTSDTTEGKLDTDNTFDLRYYRSQTRNIVSSVHITKRIPGIQNYRDLGLVVAVERLEKIPTFRFDFDVAGRVTVLDMKLPVARHSSELYEGTLLEELVKETTDSLPTDPKTFPRADFADIGVMAVVEEGKRVLRITRSRPPVINRTKTSHVWNKQGTFMIGVEVELPPAPTLFKWGSGDTDIIEYRFNAYDNMFKRVTVAGDLENGRKFLTPEEFVTLIGELAAQIPTTKIR